MEFGGETQGLLSLSRSSKVTDVGTTRKPVCDLLILTDLSLTVSKLSHSMVQILDTLRF